MDSASDRDAKTTNGGGDRGTPNHSAAMAQQVQAQAAAAAALGLLDPSALFAHSLFAAGIPASYNPMAPLPGYGLLGQGGSSPFAPPSSSSQANQAAAAQAAWWSMASQMDYLARLQHAAASASTGSSSGRSGGGGGGSSSSSAAASTFPGIAGFPGLNAADNLLASYTSAMNAAAHSSGAGGGGKSAKGSSRSNPIVRDSLSTHPVPSASSAMHTTTTTTTSQSSKTARLPAGTELKFATPEPAPSTGRKSTQNSSKSRRRAATDSVSAPSTSPSSSLSSLSSMAMSYPFFGNPLASLAMPPAMAAAVQSVQSASSSSSSSANDDKKRRKTERHTADATPVQLLRLPGTGTTSNTASASNNNNNNNVNNGTKARSQTVNGKPVALDVSSLIGKPSTSTGSEEAPLNLSMKTTKDEPAQPSTSSATTAPTTTNNSRLGRGVSVPKKNTVASLLAQSRNQRSTSPGSIASAPQAAHAASNVPSQPSAADMKAMKDNLALYTAMQELSNAKLSTAYLNGIKDSLNSGNQATGSEAIQDLLRAASLLGGFGFGSGALSSLGAVAAAANSSNASKSANSTPSKPGDSSKSASESAAKTTSNEPKTTPLPENGKTANDSLPKGNGKSTHDDTPGSDDSDSMEEDDSMIDSDDGYSGMGDGDGESRKRNADGEEGGDDRPSKRRRFVSDEAALRVPLTQGWKRETLIRSIGKSGVRGEVTYYSPSGRRFRQYPDVVRYLERQGIGGITRDNFSFSTRCIVGEFIQPLGDSPNARGIRLGEPEVRHLVDQIRIARGWKPRSRRMTEEEKEAMNRQREAQRVAQRMEAQEMARQAQEAKLQQRMERERALQEAKEARRQLREQEKLERQEAQRRERELRTQQLMEARKKRQEELDRMREEEQQRKIQELNKQRELFYTAELERERRRQHTAVVKALEARKRYEERERRREEMRAEKRAEREKKMEERRRELESWRDQRSPTEDLSLTDHKPLPDIPRITNLKLAGQAFADVLMLYEFLHTFGETLGFDMDSLPSLDSLQRALLYDSEAEEELLSVMTHLLVCAIEDPGIPHPNRHTTILGQTLKQADITTTNVSEILRIYLQANGLGDMKMPAADKISSSPLKIAPGEYPDTEALIMSEWLRRKPFLSLSPTQKASILGFMVNELLQNKAVIGQIDGAIEGQNTARRDRWVVDSKIKKLKTLHAKKHRTSIVMMSTAITTKTDAIDDSTTHDETNQSATGGKKKEDAPEAEEHAEEAEEDSGPEADDNVEQGDEDEDGNLPTEELKKKIERLSRQSAQMLTQLALSDLQLRALNMGQDRYRRRLWILPHAGGVYTEALESCEANAGQLITWDGKPAPPIGPLGQSGEPKDEPMPEAQPVIKSEEPTISEQTVPEEEQKTGDAEPMDVDKPAVKTEATEEENATAIKTEERVSDATTVPAAADAVVEAAIVEPKKEEPEALPALWFSLFPRTPCDRNTLVRLSKDQGGSDVDDDDAARKAKKEEAAKEEAEKIVMQPIPEAMSRGWWRIVDPEQVKSFIDTLHPRGVREKELNRMLTRYLDFARESCLKHTEKDHHGQHGNPKDLLLRELKNADQVPLFGGAPMPDVEGAWSRETSLRTDINVLEQIEALEDRVASASMQVKGWKLPPRATTEMNLKFRTAGDPQPPRKKVKHDNENGDDDDDDDDEEKKDDEDDDDEEEDDTVNPIQLAKERLLSVELGIERRYLKAPLGQSKGDLVQSVLSGACPSSEPPKALLTWREAVKRCETAAQMAMCFYVLETSVAWDKSIMKASCQFCHSGDKEDQLLLCDGCDKGYHTYCFRPPMENIPDGDWFCYECRNKATGQRNCIVCGKPGNKTISVLCDQCPKAYHIECLQPPLAKVPRGKWLCVMCHSKSPAKKKSSSKKSTTSRVERVSESDSSTTASSAKEAKEDKSSNDNETATATPPAATPSPRRSSSAVALKRSLNQAIAKEKDLAPCRTILDQLEAHEEAWPFLLPVNTKQFPTYKKIIRSPMDLSTIRKKLNDGIYKTRDDFCADLQLMFVNCVTFNEDDSPVGKAGHSMKTFFDSRWAELIAH